MATHVAFLRAINVAGRFVKMDALVQHLEAMGLREVQSHIQSGNVVFDSGDEGVRPLADRLEVGLERRLGFKTEVFVRTPAQLAAVVKRAQALRVAPSPADAGGGGGGELNVVFLPRPLLGPQPAVLAALCNEQEQLHAQGREIYWRSQVSQSQSSISNALLERQLKLRSTVRRASVLAAFAALVSARGKAHRI